jgi:D-alanyl-D-alanine carboxypeptidase (penicillin-binding protein 5/6)
VDATLAAMNAKAVQLGAFDTVAGTPSGLDVAGQSSSPYDLALIMRQLVADPYSLGVLQTRTAEIPGVEGLATPYQIQNQDTLLDDYPGTLAGKTGFTDAARHTFVVAAERNGRRLVVSLMQAERRPVHELVQATLLLDWGFSTPAGTSGLGRLVEPGEVPATAPAVPTPTAVSTADGKLATEETGAAVATRPAPADPAGTESPLVPLTLGGGALLVVVATVVGRRRAMRPRPVPVPQDDVRSPPSPSGAG